MYPYLNMIGSADINTMDSLKAYFKENRKNLQTDFVHLKNDLNHQEVHNQTYTRKMFLNMLCSICLL